MRKVSKVRLVEDDGSTSKDTGLVEHDWSTSKDTGLVEHDGSTSQDTGLVEHDGSTSKDTAQNNNDTENTNEKIAPDDAEGNSNVADNRRMVLEADESHNWFERNTHLGADAATDHVSTEHTLVNIACNKENGESPQRTADGDSGVAGDVDESCEFDVKACPVTETRRCDTERLTENEKGEKVTVYVSAGGDMADECAERGSETETNESDVETKERGQKQNVQKEIQSTDIVTENVQLEDKCLTFESDTFQSHVYPNSVLETKYESDHKSDEETASMEPKSCSDQSQIESLSKIKPELVVEMQLTEPCVSEADTAHDTHSRSRDQTLPMALHPISVSSTSIGLTCVEMPMRGASRWTCEVDGHRDVDRDSDLCARANYGKLDTILSIGDKDNIITSNKRHSEASTDGNDDTDGATDRNSSNYKDSHKENNITPDVAENNRLGEALPWSESNESPT